MWYSVVRTFLQARYPAGVLLVTRPKLDNKSSTRALTRERISLHPHIMMMMCPSSHTVCFVALRSYPGTVPVLIDTRYGGILTNACCKNSISTSAPQSPSFKINGSYTLTSSCQDHQTAHKSPHHHLFHLVFHHLLLKNNRLDHNPSLNPTTNPAFPPFGTV